MVTLPNAERPRRILVVEDEEEVQVLVARLLSSVGHAVDTASDGQEALSKIETCRPDLIVLDLIMPGVDGWEVLRRVRAQPQAPPVVILTGRGDYATFARGVQEGAAAYVVKPFRFHELVATCQRVLLAAGAPRREVAGERRSEPRRLLVAEVSVLGRDGQPVAAAALTELSPHGARLELAVALAKGETVRLAFQVRGDAPIELVGEVRWRADAPRGFVHGLAFRDLAEDARRQLMALLAPAVQDAQRFTSLQSGGR
jgi:DNA-binding response OmpR family regulator